MNIEGQTARVGKDTTIVAFGDFIAKAVSFLMVVLFARFLGKELFGEFTMYLMFVTVLYTFSMGWFPGTLTRFIIKYKLNNEKEKIQKAFWSVFIVPLFFICIILPFLILFREEIANFFYITTLFLLLFVVATVVLQGFFSIQTALFHAYSDFKNYALFNVTRAILYLLIFIALYFFGFPGVYSAILAFGFSYFVFVPLFYLKYSESYKITRRPAISLGVFKDISVYAKFMLVGTAVTYIYSWTDVFCLNYFLDTANVGIYRVYIGFLAILWIIPPILNTVLFPLASAYAEIDDKDKLIKITTLFMKLIFIISFVMACIFIVFGKSIILLLYGVQYTGNLTAFYILVIGYLIFAIRMGLSPALTGVLKLWKIGTYVVIISATTNLIANILLIPMYGMPGAAIGTSIGYVVEFGLMLIVVSKEVGVHEFAKNLIAQRGDIKTIVWLLKESLNLK